MDARMEIVKERLRAREAIRKRNDVESLNNSTKTEHGVDKFGADFALCKSRIETLLSSSSTADEPDSVASTAVDVLQPTLYLDALQAELKTAQKLVSDAQLFLSSYDKQVANVTLSSLVAAFNDRREKLAPKKKFAFRARKKEKNMALSTQQKLQEQEQPPTSKVVAEVLDSTCDYRDLSSVTLTETSADVVNGKDVSLHNLRDCRVRICGSPSTVHVSKLSDCVVLLGPVATSVFVDDCRRLTMAVACQQLRVHATTASDFYVHVTSRSIIEDSTGLRFAPYAWRYDGVDEHYELAGLDRGDKSGRWNTVDDFDWLVAGKPSPNWSPMDEHDRASFD